MTQFIGVAQPLMKYQYRVIFSIIEKIDQPLSDLISKQVIDCSVDLVDQNFLINLRQPKVPGFVNCLELINKSKTDIIIDFVNSSGDTTSSITLRECEMSEHCFVLDYSGEDVAVHQVKFKYRSIKEYLPDNTLDQNNSSNNLDDESMTPQQAIEKHNSNKKEFIKV